LATFDCSWYLTLCIPVRHNFHITDNSLPTFIIGANQLMT